MIIPNDVLNRIENLREEYKCEDITQKGFVKNTKKILDPFFTEFVIKELVTIEDDFKEESLTEKGYYNKICKLIETFISDIEKEKVVDKKKENSVAAKLSKFAKGKNKENNQNLVNNADAELSEPKVESDNSVAAKSKKMESDSNDIEMVEDKEKDSLGEESSSSGKSDSKDEIVTDTPERKKGVVKGKRTQKRASQPSIMTMFSPVPSAAKRKSDKFDVCSEIANNSDDSPEGKKQKKAHNDVEIIEEDKISADEQVEPKVFASRCAICRQIIDSEDLKIYPGHPEGAGEEFVALTDPKLSLFTGEEESVDEYDERPQHKITGFNVYDKEGHLCPFDGGLIERNVLIYFSGYLKPIYEEDPSIEEGIPAKDIGPINEWWIAGFDGGEKALIGFSTAFADYILMEAAESYSPFLEAVQEKIYMSKLVIEVLVNSVEPQYEDLLNKIQLAVPPSGIAAFSEDTLLRHAQFICDQVHNFEQAGDEPEDSLITSPCMRNLIKLAGVTLGKRRAMRQTRHKIKVVSKMPKFTKATTTPLVREVFETFFGEQIASDDEKKDQGPRRKRCGVCEVCQQSDCGTCTACKDMIKFGGSGKSKQCCMNRKCPNLMVAEAEDDIEDDIDDLGIDNLSTGMPSRTSKHRIKVQDRKVGWVGEPIIEDGAKKYYESFTLSNEQIIEIGDCVMVEPLEQNIPCYVARVNHMWEDGRGKKQFHANWFCRGTDTVLGEASDPQELFLIDDCEDTELSSVISKVEIVEKKISEDWFTKGGLEADESDKIQPTILFYQKWYNSEYARFEDIPKEIPVKDGGVDYTHCQSCARIKVEEEKELCRVGFKHESNGEVSNDYSYSSFKYLDKEFTLGDCVYVNADVFSFKAKPQQVTKVEEKRKNVDEDLYPEYYRKTSNSIKGSNFDTPQAFRIVRILRIFTRDSDSLLNPGDVKLRVAKFYRPEDTHKGILSSYQAEYNLLYWSEEETTIHCNDIAGKCYVTFKENISVPIDQWMKDGPDRFFFQKAYNPEDKSYHDPPLKAQLIAGIGKGKGKGKGKAKEKTSHIIDEKSRIFETFPDITRKLRSLDVFSGCGGLSEGMHQAGMTETNWAIEVFEPAAQAFRLNNPDTTVFTDDCNVLLQMVMDGEIRNNKGQVLPQKGDVEFLCGGPPCQGFSGMNRFNSRQYSQFKNSLVSSYLSFCDYYRPKYFLLENVRNFVSYKCSMVLKLTMRVLINLGYQCTFGILQAGNYGVAQTRRRAIILAAAPGEKLPLFPEPLHSFSRRACNLSVAVDGKRYTSNCKWTFSAPFRTTTVRDTMSDLPEIKNGHKKDQIGYGSEPESHFQRLIRGDQVVQVLRDHICKEMAPLVEARFRHIPTAPGSDWRDLANIITRLNDGSFSKKLIYGHHDKKTGRSSTGALRGVCQCASGRPCDPIDKQHNTLIPWCLPHTGNRHNHWAGLYGRVEWDGFFSTTITNPEPMGKQGRVLHPEQMRVVSVRECARSQGFPDTYRFYGSLIEKHRQVGNAVPPPLAKAVGLEIRKALAITERKLKPLSEFESKTKEEKMEVE